MWKRPIGLVMVCLLTSCAGLLDNPAATLVVENRGYVTEAAGYRETNVVEQTRVIRTVVAAETQVAEGQVMNNILLSTVRAGDPPTVQVIAQFERLRGTAAAAITPEAGAANTLPDNLQVLETYVAESIRDSDGCGEGIADSYPAGIPRVYAVQRLQNLPPNTLISIDWFHSGQNALQDALVTNTFEDDICIWFYVEPYSLGAWTVQFSANGVPLGNLVQFTVGQ
ncbi:MAG: hypothetical protein ACOYL5_09540 [Phototrophicaceae bacterium]|jgi:hypothetical protein